jgi:large subunit ribosomal protein L25
MRCGVLFLFQAGLLKGKAMAETVELVVKPRQERGSAAARRLRRAQLIPGVLYGHKEETVALSLPAEEFQTALRHGVRVMDLKLDGGTQKALIKEIQFDHLGKEILHVDFARIAEHDRVEVYVRIELKGIAPGVTAGGILDQPIHTVEVECLAIAIPESIRVNINELQIDQAIYVKDLVLPAGVKALADPDAIVVHVRAPLVEAEPAAAPEAAEQAEPEVIRARPAEEEGEGEK